MSDQVEAQIARYVRYIDGDDTGLPGWLEAVDLEWRRRGNTTSEQVMSFLREWVRIKRVYA
jgi:hypothetical protein